MSLWTNFGVDNDWSNIIDEIKWWDDDYEEPSWRLYLLNVSLWTESQTKIPLVWILFMRMSVHVHLSLTFSREKDSLRINTVCHKVYWCHMSNNFMDTRRFWQENKWWYSSWSFKLIFLGKDLQSINRSYTLNVVKS